MPARVGGKGERTAADKQAAMVEGRDATSEAHWRTWGWDPRWRNGTKVFLDLKGPTAAPGHVKPTRGFLRAALIAFAFESENLFGFQLRRLRRGRSWAAEPPRGGDVNGWQGTGELLVSRLLPHPERQAKRRKKDQDEEKKKASFQLL